MFYVRHVISQEKSRANNPYMEMLAAYFHSLLYPAAGGKKVNKLSASNLRYTCMYLPLTCCWMRFSLKDLIGWKIISFG